jgi:hypothetical protein
MGSFLEEILKSATSGKAGNGSLGSIIEVAKEKMGDQAPGGLGDIIGQVTNTQKKPATSQAKKPTAKDIAQEAPSDMGGLGDILGKLGVNGGKLDLNNIGDLAKSVMNVIGLAQGALGGGRK